MNINHNIQSIIGGYSESQAKKTAVMFGDSAISYYELDKRIKNTTCRLKAEGVKKGSIVAICIPNSIEMIIAIYAVLYLRT